MRNNLQWDVEYISTKNNMTETADATGGHDPVGGLVYDAPPVTKFRFKKHDKRSSEEMEDAESTTSREHKRSKRHHHHRHRHEKGRNEERPQHDTKSKHAEPQSSPFSGQLDPDTAFRESLFDAMADDEGADYWQSVYGQPVHTFAAERSNEGGPLEQMTEDEYVAWVRQKMWEKTHQGLLEEKARREAAAQAQKEERENTRKMQEDNRRFQKEMEASIRRGQERKQRKRWQEAWERYVALWEEIAKRRKGDEDILPAIPWPVVSGKLEDANETAVETFFNHSPLLSSTELAAILKQERVRWHPDKVQQRFGGALNDGDIKGVTAVFQSIDNIWSRHRK